MQFCENCGRQLPDTAKFCKGCGATVVPETKPEGPFDNEVPPQEPTPPQSKKRSSAKTPQMPAGHNPDFRKPTTQELVVEEVEEEEPQSVTKKAKYGLGGERLIPDMSRPFMTPKFMVYILSSTVILLLVWLGFIYNNYGPFHDWAVSNTNMNALYVTVYFCVAIVGYYIIWGQKKPVRAIARQQSMEEDIEESTDESEVEEVEVVEK